MKQLNVHLIVAAALIASTVAPAIWAQDISRYEIEELKRGQQEIKRQLQEIKRQQEEIKNLLQARPAAPSGPTVKDRVFDIGDNPVKGASTAKLTLVEFTDYQ
jgi:protein-disulfide isomerase